MFLLILFCRMNCRKPFQPLHSTMFLLIRRLWKVLKVICFALHSTMFLLILETEECVQYQTVFTFHNVSINTVFSPSFFHASWNFTFHNVSINTLATFAQSGFPWSLHSTMFLLIRKHFCDFFVFALLYIPQCFY